MIATLKFHRVMSELTKAERARFADTLTMIAVEIADKGEHLDAKEIVIGLSRASIKGDAPVL